MMGEGMIDARIPIDKKREAIAHGRRKKIENK
jgi:hypothetical protein